MTTSGTSTSSCAASATIFDGVTPMSSARLVVGRRHVVGSAFRCERGVLRPDARVVEPRADGVRLADLPVLVLEEQRARAVQHARDTASDRCPVAPGLEPESTRLDPDQACIGVDEACERADCVRATTDTRDDVLGIGAEERAALPTCLVADDTLQLAHDPRVRARTDHRPDAVVRRL